MRGNFMATAVLESNVQDRVSTLRDRIAASRQRAKGIFDDVRAETSIPAGINQVLSGIRGEQFPKLRSNDVSIEDATPNPGLPMMAGTTSKQK